MERNQKVYLKFIQLEESGISKNIRQINALLPLLLEEISSDQPLESSKHCLRSLLHILAWYHEIDYQLLFQTDSRRSIDCDRLDGCKISPLGYACAASNEKAARLLLSHGANIKGLNSINGHNTTALILTCMFIENDSQCKTLRLLLEWNGHINSEFDSHGNSTIACGLSRYYHQLERGLAPETLRRDICLCLDLLFQAGANVNAVNTSGESALHLVCSKNDIEMAKTLIAYGADCRCRNKKGEYPIDRITDPTIKKQLQIFKF